MVNIEIKLPDGAIAADGQMHILPRIGETILLDDTLFFVKDIIWEFDKAYTFNAKVTLYIKARQ